VCSRKTFSKRSKEKRKIKEVRRKIRKEFLRKILFWRRKINQTKESSDWPNLSAKDRKEYMIW
jgi:hypothetical protein